MPGGPVLREPVSGCDFQVVFVRTNDLITRETAQEVSALSHREASVEGSLRRSASTLNNKEKNKCSTF